MNKIVRFYILSALMLTAGGFVFADQPGPSSDDKQVHAPQPPAGVTSADTQSSYLYDLKKLIAKSRENIKEVNEKIKEQAILKRNQKREERAREYYEKGLALTKDGRLDEAREYFEKAIRITDHPEMAGYIKESQRRLKKQEDALHAQEREHYKQIKQDENTRKEDVEAAYKEAVDLYKQKKFHPAKDAFEHVDEIAPDYRATESYLKIIDQDIATADALAAKQQAIEIQRQQKEAEAARVQEKAAWMAQIEQKEKERKEAIYKQAEEVYEEAVQLYKNKKFAEAKKKFAEVSWVIPDYKSTIKYLNRIDHDAELEKERAAQEQQKVLQEQRWQEEVERKKQELERQHDLQIKERRHKEQIEEQAQFLYTAAVNLYDKKDMQGALVQFGEVEKIYPDFKSTRAYIERIQPPAAAAPEVVPAARPVVAIPFGNDDHQKQSTDERRRAQEFKAMTDQAQGVYNQALDSYHHHQWEEARAQFKAVERIIPDFKHTRRYLQKTEEQIARNPGVQQAVPQPAAPAPSMAAPAAVPYETIMPPPVQVAISIEDQQKQEQEIASLAEKSAQLYRQVSDVADDSLTIQTKRKMAKLDDILNSLKKNKERLLHQMQEAQWKQQREESKAKQEERRARAEKTYQEAMEFLRSHDYAKAKIKFLELENIVPDYKSTRRYLSRIDEDIKKANVEAVTGYEQNQAAHLKQLQDKADVQQQLRTQQEQEKQREIAQQQQASLKELAQKASDINDDIIRLSKTQDLAAMKAKFVELENTITALTTLKDEMAKQKDSQERQKELARESAQRRNEVLRSQNKEDREIHAYSMVRPVKEARPVLSNQSSDVDQYKRREVVQEQNTLFNEAVDRYEHKKYTQAKLLFGELANQHDHRAEEWLKKVDHAITHELLNSQVREEKERTAFIADQVRAQRELIVIQERERQRQKKLTEELEHQKRLYEDDRLLQLRKEEVLKAQERERQRQEALRLRAEHAGEKQQQNLRFHKIQPEAKPVSPPVRSKPTPPPVPPSTPGVAEVKPPAMTPQQLKAQIDFSKERKTFLDNKYNKEQREKTRQEKIKAAQEARQKRIEERQKEKERQEQLRSQREADRRAKLKADAETREKLAKALAEKSAQEAKRREETQRQEQQQREERMRQQEIVRQEAQHREEMERQERQRQAQLEAQREAVRKQLEDGVEVMYQDAMRLYQQGEYTAAADRFKDVQDILPGYKRTEQYMDQARSKAVDASPVSRQDNVSKALDLFDAK